MKLPFAKVQSVGNDFVLVDADETPSTDWPQLARLVSPRRFAVGSDGLLVLGRRGSKELTMRMFNPDGSEDFCGNGLRSAAWYARERGWISEEFTIEHRGSMVTGRFLGSDSVQVVIPPASFHPEDIPMCGAVPLIDEPLEDWIATAVSTGSTHLVLTAQALPPSPRFEEVGARLEQDRRFPHRTSVIWAREDDPEKVSIRIWERGAGETLGCGTGSAAVAAAWTKRRGKGGTFAIENPGGTVWVELADAESPIAVSSDAQVVYTGVIDF